MVLIHNERAKLLANWLNTLATALIAAGVFAPAAALVYGAPSLSLPVDRLLLLATGCFAVGGILHVLGWLALGRLRE
ncbi:MAG: hypothetical protein OJF62_001800 [Pseudolabrys sp.]|jgi:hypothetical protein|nr:hypothetical protein [Pseudolabrys sp.]